LIFLALLIRKTSGMTILKYNTGSIFVNHDWLQVVDEGLEIYRLPRTKLQRGVSTEVDFCNT
jgi:hypothetical protein